MVSSNLTSWFFKAIIFTILANRVLFTFETFKKFSIERNEDLYLKANFCNNVDRKSIGRHTTICLEADRRLSTPRWIQTLKYVVDDTLYRELQMHQIASITAVLAAVIMVGHLHTRYLKNNIEANLPIVHRKPSLKLD